VADAKLCEAMIRIDQLEISLINSIPKTDLLINPGRGSLSYGANEQTASALSNLRSVLHNVGIYTFKDE
jgi:hypothetical protein